MSGYRSPVTTHRWHRRLASWASRTHVGGLPSLTLTGLSGVGVQDARDRSSVTDPAVLRVLLKVREGAGGGYSWVTCGGCDAGWQVPYYAESVG